MIFFSDGRNHYVYRISDLETGKHYYGSRVCSCSPKDDLGIKYFSSSSNKEFISNQKQYPHRFKYKILRISDSPGDNILFESYLHSYFQVSSSQWFLNQSNQTPFGFTVTGNKTVSKRRQATLSKIDSKTGLTGYQKSSLKRQATLSKVDSKTGLTGYQKSDLKRQETISQIEPKTGLTRYQLSDLKRQATLSKVDSKTGLTGYQLSDLKRQATLSQIDLKTNLTFAQKSEIKRTQTMLTIDIETGLTGFEKSGQAITGKNNGMFKGYFIVLGKKYITAKDVDIGISVTLIRLWCKKNNLNKVSDNGYTRSKYLKSRGTRSNIVGKTYKELGFSFEYC